MYKNLARLLQKKNITLDSYGRILGITRKSAYNKLNGVTGLTLSEAMKTRELFPEYTFEYIFADEDRTGTLEEKPENEG